MKPSKKELFYNRFSSKWGKYINQPETIKRLNIVYKNLLEKIDFKGKEFLEIGCGLGYFSLEAKRKKAKVTAIDVGDNLVQITKNIVKDGNFIVASASDLPFKNNTFDVVLCTEVIEHVKCQKKAFNEMFRVLKNDGYLVITTPNKFFKPMFDLLNVFKIRKYQGYENWLSINDMREVFQKHKVSVVKEVFFNFIYPSAVFNHFEKINFLKRFMINQGYLIKK